ncbi:ABC-F family ATP-binding cassette domain-containing protein [Legionella jordanis]|uniref:Probable ATP-binding protein YheS n=1 Tax=Legionella jordanis TaxID=456 RepID=A0A0W0VF75_9GAMM|nr:ATP-binding cassette domain-containing protein [Legionella jordanis]KTD18454.1 ABC transporter ATP binding protein [Legionella jordanis]RMX05359.1 ATP-binding cassette domain-containing protein [Legionella jordanis]RMX20793.1 ATP-binding cassette domain-containing protein [Legionella jordanis]VEH13198.1 ABC transporter ATP binding protein [Legionella jordanis]HAT8715026.1 ATP-binding cassette domain-containing protein [Legionella jordanis]
MLTFNQISLARGNKILLENSSATLFEKQKVGLVGHNGCGKSSLFALILGQLQCDSGEYIVNPQLKISHLSQQLPDSEETALDFVLAGDEEYIALQRRLARAETHQQHAEVLLCHEQLKQTGGYSKPAQAAAIMAGLGFSKEEQTKSVNSFSGGWRMRLSLARCLMKPADLMLLDEPTNHLDMEAIFWLERWLKQCPSSILLISHDREFLDAIVTDILHIEQRKLNLYRGNYSRFEQTRAQQLALQQMMYEKQQQKITHMMAYVNRFRAKASKAKQAQSRLNAIEKMDLIAQAQVDSPFSFNFYPCPRASNPLIHCSQVSAGYSDEAIILKHLNLNISLGDRVALLGPNGQGKSTLIKTLTGSLSPLAGTIHRAQHLHIGYYAQHQLEDLDNSLSPTQTIQNLSPEAKEQQIRDFLGGFNFIGDMAQKPIHYFSGGEKARLALAKLVWQKPNLLLLDEPTNHLDLEMRAAIEIALQSYEGAMILISHDRHLLRTTVDNFYLVYAKEVREFKGDLEDYYHWLQNREPKKEHASVANTSYREKKSLQNRMKKLEQMVNQLHEGLQELEHKLADLSLYETGQEKKLQGLLKQQRAMKEELSAAEQEWLTVADELEQ